MISLHARQRWIRVVAVAMVIVFVISHHAFALDHSFLSGIDLGPLQKVSSVDTVPQGEMASGSERKSDARHDPADSLFSKDYYELLWEDTKYVLTAPTRWEKKEWLGFSLAAAAIGAAAVFDKPVWDFMRRNQAYPVKSVVDVLGEVGGIYSVAVFLPFYVTGKAFDNQKAVEVALDGWSASLIAAGIIVPSMKFIIGRTTPESDQGTYSFRPLSYSLQIEGGRVSFPSGHAAQGFAIASVLSAHYDQLWVKILSYGMASLTSTARLYQGEHWLSDWAAGALIGTFVGTTVVHFNEKRRREKREQQVFILPLIYPGAMGLSVTIRH